MIDVSVIIPTYNRPTYVSAAVSSVIAQTAPPREIIVVDNGTNEDTARSLAVFGKRIVYIRQRPRGVQVARNTGVGFASSRWISTLDDDDTYEPTFLEKTLPIMENSRANLVFSDFRKHWNGRRAKNSHFKSAPKDYWRGIPGYGTDCPWSFVGKFPPENLLKFIPFYPSTMIMKRDLYLSMGGHDPLVRGIKSEDIEFLARALLAGELAIVWEELLAYHMHDSNDSADALAAQIGRWRIFEMLRSKPELLTSKFISALDEDLPLRAAGVFDNAFRVGDFRTALEVQQTMREADWTITRKLKQRIATFLLPATHVILSGVRLARRVKRTWAMAK